MPGIGSGDDAAEAVTWSASGRGPGSQEVPDLGRARRDQPAPYERGVAGHRLPDHRWYFHGVVGDAPDSHRIDGKPFDSADPLITAGPRLIVFG